MGPKSSYNAAFYCIFTVSGMKTWYRSLFFHWKLFDHCFPSKSYQVWKTIARSFRIMLKTFIDETRHLITFDWGQFSASVIDFFCFLFLFDCSVLFFWKCFSKFNPLADFADVLMNVKTDFHKYNFASCSFDAVNISWPKFWMPLFCKD